MRRLTALDRLVEELALDGAAIARDRTRGGAFGHVMGLVALTAGHRAAGRNLSGWRGYREGPRDRAPTGRRLAGLVPPHAEVRDMSLPGPGGFPSGAALARRDVP
jgi:hypothetical protein